MAVFWVQHYFSLPIIYEDSGMGDELHIRRQPSAITDSDNQLATGHIPLQTSQQSAMEVQGFPSQNFAINHYADVPSLNMVNMVNSLPDLPARHYGQPPFQHQFSPMTHLHSQYPIHHQQTGYLGGQQYSSQHSQQYPMRIPHPQQQRYAAHQTQQYQPNSPANTQHFSQQTFYPQQPGLQQMSNIPQQYLQPAAGQQGSNFDIRTAGNYHAPPLRLDSTFTTPVGLSLPSIPYHSLSRHSSDSSLKATVPRGPPRKPKQSGHALWVGNLPPGTHIIDLKDHFAKDAREDIESVFLISKSNCAFVNYKSETACVAAMSRFHDSRFQGVRLVCRLRRGSTPTSASAPSPSGQGGTSHETADAEPATPSQGTTQDDTTTEPTQPFVTALELPRVPERYFVVKSLTMEDLEMSVQNGVWATQAHNEAALNSAFQTADNVYLVFSANKSGEYFGYARMMSEITDQEAAKIELPVRHEGVEPLRTDMPVTTPTIPTVTAPKGHIIDDSARGTIFWEADSTKDVNDSLFGEIANTSAERDASAEGGSTNAPSFGKPFRITWLSTERLPFYRTRGLRNPWNSNREVKIARDGTELEPSVGRRLIAMFHRPQAPSQSPTSLRSQGHTSTWNYTGSYI